MAQDVQGGIESVVGAVVRALHRQGECSDDLQNFAQLLIDSAGVEAVAGYDADTLAAFVREAFSFLSIKPAAGPLVRIRASELPAGARTRRVATIQALNDDMPFLVDSVMGEVQAHGLSPLLVAHPIFKTRRDAAGRLLAILGPGDQNWGDGRQESYLAVILDPIDEMLAHGLLTSLPQVLGEVRAAVADWRPMLALLDAAIEALVRAHGSAPPAAVAEAITFCRWLRGGHFTFLGARRLARGLAGGPPAMVAEPALGLLRGRDDVVLTGPAAALLPLPPVTFTRTPLLSRVHRRTAMSCVGVTLPDSGRIELIGLLTSSAYTQSPREIPLLRQKVAAVLAGSGHPPQSHAGKALLNVIETFPREELFLATGDELSAWTRAVLDLDLRPRVRLIARIDPAQRDGAGAAAVSAIVYVPRDRFSTATRERIAAILEDAWSARITGFTPFFPEGPLVRIHFHLVADQAPAIDLAALEAHLAAAVRSWDDQLAEALTSAGQAAAAGLFARYRHAFPAGYQALLPAVRAVEDITRIERLGPDRATGIDFHKVGGEPASQLHATFYRLGPPMPLSDRVPMLENFGFASIDERTFEIAPQAPSAAAVALHDMRLETIDRAPMTLTGCDERLEAAMLAVICGEADNDSYNRLVLVAGLDWRDAAVLRAYAAYMRQIPVPFGPRYIADTLARHADTAHALVELFRTRFDPALDLTAAARRARESAVRERIEAALERVASLDEDRIIRLLTGLIGATLRTNAFQRPDDTLPSALAFKLDSGKLEALPAPRPYREIWVFSPRVEGVHLRFAPIARGGIRWSDRAQDFRTEVLGLARAQQVKNAVIVPQGAKGGFLPKRLPRSGERDEVAREALAAYRIFIGALLDVTDNLVGGDVVPPARVVRHDGDDPYLVVAADKGTATFSDTANDIALARGFWLGDAFASGGTSGYDHKGMGITARGAFECIKRHFREMDRDILTEPFSVVGVGDMSGDVFGNGMLLSAQTRLIAAFDHRDIFIDPEPDVAASLAERQRLFALARSSWQDYDHRCISPGGGVFSRAAKSITLSPQASRALGIEARQTTPAELIRAILRAPCDLLWLGGIGTYVKASDESDEQVGDRANDGVRVSAGDVRAKVVGEGANLGVTQRGRIELARAGCRLDTDFIDNSAGVNTSDQEVNIKIALAPATASGRLPAGQRRDLLKAMTPDVAAASLRNNAQQSLALSIAEQGGAGNLGYLQRLMLALEQEGRLDRRLEALPSNGEMAQRQAAGKGLTRPELAVLLSLAKISLTEALLASRVPDLDEPRALVLDYFPAAMRQHYRDDIETHPLRREIVTTLLTNAIVNRGGPAFVVRLREETGRGAAEIVEACLAARAALRLPALWQQIDDLDRSVAGSLQLAMHVAAQQALLASSRWLARHGQATLAAARVAAAVTLLDDERQIASLPSSYRDRLHAAAARLAAGGVPEAVARRVAALPLQSQAPAVTALATATGAPLQEAMQALIGMHEQLRLETLLARADEIPARDHYDRLAIEAAASAMHGTAERLAQMRLAGAGEGARLAERTGSAVAELIDEALSAGVLTASRLTVLAHRIGDLSAR